MTTMGAKRPGATDEPPVFSGRRPKGGTWPIADRLLLVVGMMTRTLAPDLGIRPVSLSITHIVLRYLRRA